MSYDQLNELLTILEGVPFGKNAVDIHDGSHTDLYTALDDVLAELDPDEVATATQQRAVDHARVFQLYGQWRQHIDTIDPSTSMALFDAARDAGLNKKLSRWVVGWFAQLRRTYHSLNHNWPGQWSANTQVKQSLWTAIFGATLRRYINALCDAAKDIPVVINTEPGINHSRILRVLEASVFVPFSEKEDGERTPTMIHVKLDARESMQQHSALFGHRKNTLPVGPKTADGALSSGGTHHHIVVEHMERATSATWEALAHAMQTRTYTVLGADDASSWEGRLFLLTELPLRTLLEQNKVDLTTAYHVCGYELTLPALRVHLAQDPDARRWWLNHLHEQWLGSVMSAGAIAQVEETFDDALGTHYTWPGNELEMMRALKHVALTNRTPMPVQMHAHPVANDLTMAMSRGEVTIKTLTTRYCHMLYERFGTYEAVSSHTGLDRRTVKKYIDAKNV